VAEKTLTLPWEKPGYPEPAGKLEPIWSDATLKPAGVGDPLAETLRSLAEPPVCRAFPGWPGQV